MSEIPANRTLGKRSTCSISSLLLPWYLPQGYNSKTSTLVAQIKLTSTHLRLRIWIFSAVPTNCPNQLTLLTTFSLGATLKKSPPICVRMHFTLCYRLLPKLPGLHLTRSSNSNPSSSYLTEVPFS